VFHRGSAEDLNRLGASIGVMAAGLRERIAEQIRVRLAKRLG
jgi:hypothetical protein